MKKQIKKRGKKASSKKADDDFEREMELLLKEYEEDGWHVEFDEFEGDDCPLCVEMGMESRDKTLH